MGIFGKNNNAQTTTVAPKSHWRRRLVLISLLLVAALAAYTWFVLYYPVVDDGTRTGVVRKLSHKGIAVKTWEGELQMSGIVTPSDPSQIINGGNIWAFSVMGDDQTVVEALRGAESRGTRVTLHYKQFQKTFTWRGDTPYFITSVEEVK